jgi:hypothetical protein
MRFRTRFNLCVLAAASTVTFACREREPKAPAAQAETATSQPANQPTTVTGCLRAGEAENTFVLTTAKTVDGRPTTTYELSGNAGVNLLDHIGYQVEVSGVINEKSQIATRQPPQAAERATGTGGTPGTPTVQTETQLSIQRLDVSGIKRADGHCEL